MANALAYLGYQQMPSGSQSHLGKYSLTFSGSYVNGTGESVSFLTASNPNGIELNGAVPMGFFDEGVPEQLSANIGGYDVQFSGYAAGVFTVKVFTSGGTELGSGAYPAGVTAGNVTIGIPSRF